MFMLNKLFESESESISSHMSTDRRAVTDMNG